jgi:resuscitation-promoting factor RpfB
LRTKGLLVAGLAGCAVAAPAVASATIPETTQDAGANAGLPTESTLGIDAAYKRTNAIAEAAHVRAQKVRHHKHRSKTQSQSSDWSGGAPSQLRAIALCESSGNPAATSGPYGGLYQFDAQTWASVGGTGDPASASPAEQTKRAEILLSQRGTSAWPVCGARG